MLVTAYASILFVSAILAATLAVQILRRHAAAGAWVNAAMAIVVALWSSAYAIELLATDLNTKLFWAKVQYLGIAAIAPLWFVFVFYALRQPFPLRHHPRRFAVMVFVPLVTVILVWTNEYHGLIWAHVALDLATPWPHLNLVYGVWFWVHMIYAYLLLFSGVMWTIVALLDSTYLFRRQARLVLLGMGIVWAANAAFIAGWPLLLDLDPTPFAFTIAVLIYSWAFVRLNLLDIVHLARKTVFQELRDPVMILDVQNRIVDLNLAMQHLAGLPMSALIGQPVAWVLGDNAHLIEQSEIARTLEAEIELAGTRGPRVFELHVSPLIPYRKTVRARLVELHEITDQKQAARALRTLNQSLEQRILTRTQALQAEIEERARVEEALRLAEARYRNLFEEAPVMYVITRNQGGVPLVADCNELFVKTLGYTRAEILQRSLGDFYTTESCEALFAGGYQRAIDGLFSIEERQLLTRDGHIIETQLHTNPEVNLDGSVTGTRAMFVDISARKQAEVRLIDMRDQLRSLAQRSDSVREEERSRIAREIHDELGQMLTALKLDTGWLARHLSQEQPTVQSKVQAMSQLISEMIKTVQQISAELRPSMLDTLGLAAAIQWQLQEFEARTEIHTEFVNHLDEQQTLERNLSTALFRILQESLTNILRHARATSLTVNLEQKGTDLELRVRDNGIGIDPSSIQRPDSFGLMGMQERIRPWNGNIDLRGAQNQGTTLTVTVPLPRVAELHEMQAA